MYKIAILSPDLPPSINALGDYSILVANKLAEFDNKVFLITTFKSKVSYSSAIIAIQKKANSLKEALQKINCNTIIVNYSGYGYQNKGLPFWLIKALTIVKQAGIQIHIIFHELYASTNNITSLLFYTSLLQKKLYHKIALLATHLYCTNERMLHIIHKQLPQLSNKTSYLPLFSNVPTLSNDNNVINRKPQAIVFGTLGRRNAVYANYKEVNVFLQQHNINTIIDIGEGNANTNNINISVEKKGRLSLEEVAIYLQQSTIGLIDYRNDLLAKSGIFAAYAGNGLAIINTQENIYPALDDIQHNKNFIAIQNTAIPSINLSVIAINAFNWYQNRSINNITKKLISLIKQ